jgi:4-hydroxythreonine-4-phosphate dehydrogenase
MNRKKVIISSGDPAGCGPLITVSAIQRLTSTPIDFTVVGDRAVIQHAPGYKKIKSRFRLIDVATPGISRLRTGTATPLSGRAAINSLTVALYEMARTGIKRLITAPLSKEAVQMNIRNFQGHTEYLGEYFRVSHPVMMMVSGKTKIVLLTRHIPYRKVPDALNIPFLADTLVFLSASLKKMAKIKKPKIAVASLNPHAGNDTFLGEEERTIIAAIRRSGEKIAGPFPADTLFLPHSTARYDCILALYHDQGMIPFKLLSFHKGVNVTLGLPIIRTSPAHGVAYDLIKAKRRPFASSMEEAIRMATRLTP